VEQTSRALGRRAAAGAAAVALRSVVAQVIALVCLVFLTRHLSPSDFGVLAVGLAATALATGFADGGLAAGLIRSPTPPTTRQLRVALGLQLVTMTLIAATFALVLSPFGSVGLVSAVMLSALPVVAFQTPGRIVLERDLEYGRVAVAELAQTIAYWGGSVILVFAGLGVWGVAVGSVLGVVFGSLVLRVIAPAGAVRPAFSWSESRPLLRFGAAFQAVNLTNLARDQGLNVAVGLVLGLPGLGIWNVASRAIQAPMTLFNAVWRVSYPTMSRVVRHDRAPTEILTQASAFAAVACGFILVPLGATAPRLVDVIFGSRWHDAGPTVSAACAALMIGGPVSLAVGGYLYAIGQLRLVLLSTFTHTAAWFAVSVPLMPLVGVSAIGIGWIAGAIADAGLLGWGARVHARANVWAAAGPVTCLALAVGASGFAVTDLVLPSDAGVWFVAAVGSGALVVYACALGSYWFLRRSDVSAQAVQASYRMILHRPAMAASGELCTPPV
jgi:O-antigen/teichoic acid export membrane protein